MDHGITVKHIPLMLYQLMDTNLFHGMEMQTPLVPLFSIIMFLKINWLLMVPLTSMHILHP